MTIVKTLILTAAAAAAIEVTLAPQTASAQCYGYGCYSAGGPRAYHRASNWYGGPSLYQAQAYYPNVTVYGDATGLYALGYATGYRGAYGCLWLDRNCPW
jgi:hypothetical protein